MDAVLSILNEAAQWLLDRGIDQWHPGQWRREQLLKDIRRGETFFAREESNVVGTITLQWSDEFFWPQASRDAGYVHRLAVTSAAHGRGVGRRLVEWAEREARARGLVHLRLDCACDNPRLRGYYEALGFRGRGERPIFGNWGSYCAALYEKALGR